MALERGFVKNRLNCILITDPLLFKHAYFSCLALFVVLTRIRSAESYVLSCSYKEPAIFWSAVDLRGNLRNHEGPGTRIKFESKLHVSVSESGKYPHYLIFGIIRPQGHFFMVSGR